MMYAQTYSIYCVCLFIIRRKKRGKQREKVERNLDVKPFSQGHSLREEKGSPRVCAAQRSFHLLRCPFFHLTQAVFKGNVCYFTFVCSVSLYRSFKWMLLCSYFELQNQNHLHSCELFSV